MPGYAVVQFTDWNDGKSAPAVPESWLVVVNGDLKCYFPSVNAQAAIKKCTAAHADWPIYSVRRLTHKTVSMYSVARMQQKRAMNTSCLDTSDAEESVNVQTKRKSNAGKLMVTVLENQH